MSHYRDNYPHNIEAPQRLILQYSQDIDFDYSTGKYPLGEEHEGFIWEDVYIPVAHDYNGEEVGKHVWIRWKVGQGGSWNLPAKLTEAFSNIASTDPEIDIDSGTVTFRFKYVLDDGTVVYSEPISLQNGIDGRGIINASITGTDLHLSYTDGSTENLGRVVGFDGNGFALNGPDGGIPIYDGGGNVVWMSFEDALDTYLNATSPIDLTSGVLSHIDTDGNKHIPVGGNLNDSLTTDGAGNYSWESMIPFTSIDDSAGTGDVDKLYSADKITNLLASASAFGIKYSVALIADLATIPSPIAEELAVVDEDRYVYKYNGATWSQFFALDATHNHDDRYYTETELNTSGGGGQVHWDNITSKPTLYTSWTADSDLGSVVISDGDTLDFEGGAGISTSISGSTLTITADNVYSEGAGIDITTGVISHEDTSSILNTANIGGNVLQNLEFDAFGHVTVRTSLDMDTRYYNKAYVDTNFYDTTYIDTNYHDSTYVDNNFLTNNTPSLNIKTEVIEIGPWNMDSLDSVDVNWTQPANSIITNIQVIIHADGTQSDPRPLNFAYTVNNNLSHVGSPPLPNVHSFSTNESQGSYYYDTSNSKFVLNRLPASDGGFFWSSPYNSPSLNRGYITVTYVQN